MTKKNATILIIVGIIIVALSIGVTIIDILDTIERSQYQNLSRSFPMDALRVLIFGGGVAAIVMGIRKKKEQ